jgi:hypothetical protein
MKDFSVSCGLRTEPLYTTRLLNLTNMTSIVYELYPSIKCELEVDLVNNLQSSLFDKLDDKLYIQLYSAPNDSVELELSYE